MSLRRQFAVEHPYHHRRWERRSADSVSDVRIQGHRSGAPVRTPLRNRSNAMRLNLKLGALQRGPLAVHAHCQGQLL